VKRDTLSAAWLVLAFAVALSQFIPPSHAQSQSQDPSSQQPPGQQQPEQQRIEAFVGQVIKAKNGQYALLTDRQAGKGYYLDDQEKAKQFDGQNVRVTGTLDASTNTIHITNIRPA